MSFKLYEINDLLNQAIDSAFATVNEETGEISDDWYKFLNDVQAERDKKVLDVARYIKNLDAEAEAIKKEKDSLAKRQKAADNRAIWLKNYLQSCVKAGEKISDANTAISWRKSSKLEVLSESAVPEQFWKVKREIAIQDLKEFVKHQEVEYAKIVENVNIQIK